MLLFLAHRDIVYYIIAYSRVVVFDSCHGLGLGHGSRVIRVTGQLNDGSRGSWVTKCNLLSALVPLMWAFNRDMFQTNVNWKAEKHT